jgi:hypothetical protein
MPLEEIARRLRGLSTGDVEALLAEEDEHPAAREEAAPSPSPRAYIESLLRRSRPSPPPAPAPPQVAGYPAPSGLPVAFPAQAPPAPIREHAVHYPAPGAPQPASPAAGVAMRSAKMASMPDAARAVVAKETTWKRWELAPGLELQVEVGLEANYKALIEALLRLAATKG